MYRILIVEDDAAIAGVLTEELSALGYETARVEDFTRVMEAFGQFAPQLVLLDLSLPYRGGFHWCSEIRKVSKVPVIFVTSAGDAINHVTALHQGADDFIAKPFDMHVLAAKVNALLRRAYDFDTGSEVLSCRGAVLDVEAMVLKSGQGDIDLSRNEFRILQLLMAGKGKVVSREAIMRALWEDENFIDDNTLTVNVNRLRRKLEGQGLDDFILTVKGEGYSVPREEG